MLPAIFTTFLWLGVSIIILILQMRNPRLRELRDLLEVKKLIRNSRNRTHKKMPSSLGHAVKLQVQSVLL